MSLLDDPQYVAALRSGESNVAIGKKFGTSEKSVRRAKKSLGILAPTAPLPSGETTETSDGAKSVTAVRTRPITLEDARAWIAATGDNPDDYTLSIRSIAYGEGLFSNRMSAVPKRNLTPTLEHDIDPVGILAELRRRTPPQPFTLELSGDESAFCLSINDLQLGQSYNGGSAATIARFYEFVDLAVERVKELRQINRALETLVIVGGGDLVEGCVIYPNMAFSLDLNRKQQIEGVVALLLHAIDTLAPMFKHVKVLAAAGNHGQNRINGNYTTMDDNDDTHSFEMVKLALSRDPNMQHIEWVIAESESGVTVNVYDWVLATTHGDIYAKGVAGATIDKKAHAWMKNMALGRGRFGSLGAAHVLVGHHFHHEKSSDWGSCLWKQTPSQDRGSPYFEQASGEYSEPGMLTWVMTPKSRWKDEAVLR